MARLHSIAESDEEHLATVVFVHGLGGDCLNTWRNKEDNETFWPASLASELRGLSVCVLEYPAAASEWCGSSMPLQDVASTILEVLQIELARRPGPIFFVCHSLGGLVIKQVLRRAVDISFVSPSAATFLGNVRGIEFIATPHTGSSIAETVRFLGILLRLSVTTQQLIKNDPALRDLNIWHRTWSHMNTGISYKVFYETRPILGVQTVSPDSADPGLVSAAPIAVDADHVSICKPVSRSEMIYQSTLQFIKGNTDPKRPSSPRNVDYREIVTRIDRSRQINSRSTYSSKRQFLTGSIAIGSMAIGGGAIVWGKRKGYLGAMPGGPVGMLSGHEGVVRSAHFDPQNKRIVTASDDKTVRIWDVASKQPVKTLRIHHGDVISAVFSPDGSLVASASEDKNVRLWNVENGSLIKVFSEHDDAVYSVQFSSDGFFLLTPSYDGEVVLWSIDRGRKSTIVTSNDGPVYEAVFSPDENLVATAGKSIYHFGRNIRIWQAKTGTESAYAVHDGHVSSVAFSPDGKELVSGSGDGIVRIWRSTDGTMIGELSGHAGPVQSVTFSPNGRFILSASRDLTAKIWDRKKGSCSETLMGHKGPVNSARFNNDGTLIVTASSDGTAMVWPFTKNELAAAYLPISSV